MECGEVRDFEVVGSNPAIPTVAVAEAENATGCGPVLCGFEPRRSPGVDTYSERVLEWYCGVLVTETGQPHKLCDCGFESHLRNEYLVVGLLGDYERTQ